LKAALLIVGIRVPHSHDLSAVLTGAINKFPEWFKEKVPSFALHSRVMSIIRVYATYGYEPTGTPPKELFRQHDANMCIKNAEDVWFSCIVCAMKYSNQSLEFLLERRRQTIGLFYELGHACKESLWQKQISITPSVYM